VFRDRKAALGSLALGLLLLVGIQCSTPEPKEPRHGERLKSADELLFEDENVAGREEALQQAVLETAAREATQLPLREAQAEPPLVEPQAGLQVRVAPPREQREQAAQEGPQTRRRSRNRFVRSLIAGMNGLI
jgi:hypothetical protein